MTFDEFIIAAVAYARRHPEQRIGQACMNALRWCNERVYHQTTLDVWEVEDYRTPDLLAWFEEVERLW